MGILSGYGAARSAAAWYRFDGDLLLLTGKDRFDVINRLTTNAVRVLPVGGGVQTALLNEKARILDVFTLVEAEFGTLALCAPGSAEGHRSLLKKFLFIEDCKVAAYTDKYRGFVFTGPSADLAVSELFGVLPEALRELKVACSVSGALAEVPVLVVRMPALCEWSLLVFIAADEASLLESVLESAGESLPEISARAYEVLRIEQGQGLVGKELSTAYNPLEAGLVGLVDFKKGCYVGQEVVARLDAYNKVKMRLSGFVSAEPMSAGAAITVDGKEVGSITSSVYSPSLESHVALGYIRSDSHAFEAEVGVGEGVRATVKKLPLVQ